jgi:hypothetical protein
LNASTVLLNGFIYFPVHNIGLTAKTIEPFERGIQYWLRINPGILRLSFYLYAMFALEQHDICISVIHLRYNNIIIIIVVYAAINAGITAYI